MNTFAKSLLVVTALVVFGANSAMAATTPAQCYATKAAANALAHRAAKAACSQTEAQKIAQLNVATSNALAKGPASYAAFRGALGLLSGIGVPSATSVELSNINAWASYVRRVSAGARVAVEDIYIGGVRRADDSLAGANAAARRSCGL
jgi:hypothetical protein